MQWPSATPRELNDVVTTPMDPHRTAFDLGLAQYTIRSTHRDRIVTSAESPKGIATAVVLSQNRFMCRHPIAAFLCGRAACR